MKEELEKLGFRYNDKFRSYDLQINDLILCVYRNKDVTIDYDDEVSLNIVPIFKYDYNKVKQLIELLK